MLRRWLCQVDVALAIEPRDPILIKSGYATVDGPDMVPVMTYRNGQSCYYFPGSSLKGVLRSHFERIARSLRPGSVCLPYYDPKHRDRSPIPDESERHSGGCGFRMPENLSTAETYRRQCAACRMFGSLEFAGRFSISDAYPKSGSRPVGEVRNAVGIDRFTGGTVHGALFELKAVVGGCFETSIRLMNFETWQLAALILLLVDLRDGLLTIGSGRSRGLGGVNGRVEKFVLSYLRPISGLQGLEQLVTPEERDAYGLFSGPSAASISLPEPTRQGLRHQYALGDRWMELSNLIPSVEAFLEAHNWPQCLEGVVA